jgi:hypothetical protein
VLRDGWAIASLLLPTQHPSLALSLSFLSFCDFALPHFIVFFFSHYLLLTSSGSLTLFKGKIKPQRLLSVCVFVDVLYIYIYALPQFSLFVSSAKVRTETSCTHPPLNAAWSSQWPTTTASLSNWCTCVACGYHAHTHTQKKKSQRAGGKKKVCGSLLCLFSFFFHHPTAVSCLQTGVNREREEKNEEWIRA